MARLRWRWQRQSAAARPHSWSCSPTDWHVVGTARRLGGRVRDSVCSPGDCRVSTLARSRCVYLYLSFYIERHVTVLMRLQGFPFGPTLARLCYMLYVTQWHPEKAVSTATWAAAVAACQWRSAWSRSIDLIHPMAGCTSRSRCRTTWRSHDRPVLQSIDLADLQTAAGAQQLVTALQRDGVALLTPPGPEQRKRYTACYTACRDFFSRPFDEKADHGAGSGVGQQHGYMSMLDDGGSECFEVKLVHDDRFQWPESPANFSAAVRTAFDSLHATALDVLDAVLNGLGMPRQHVRSLLDEPVARSRLDEASHTAMRVWSYTHGVRSGWHADNSLLTLSPQATAVGLHVRLLDGRCATAAALDFWLDCSYVGVLLCASDAVGAHKLRSWMLAGASTPKSKCCPASSSSLPAMRSPTSLAAGCCRSCTKYSPHPLVVALRGCRCLSFFERAERPSSALQPRPRGSQIDACSRYLRSA